MTTLAVIGALVAGFFTGTYRRNRCARREHVPRALRLPQEWIETTWGEDVVSLKKPPPTSMPGPPERRRD